MVAHRILVEAVDERAAMGLDHQPALAVEGDDGLAYRDPADPEFGGDLVLTQVVALLQLALEDEPADVLGDEFAAAAPVSASGRTELGHRQRGHDRRGAW